jgi:hypothetical protein
MWEKIDMHFINFYRSGMMIFAQEGQILKKRSAVYGAKVFGYLGQKGHFWSMKNNGGHV